MGKSIAVFYTWSGKTKEMAEKIAALTGAQLVEIKAAVPYSEDYKTCVDQSRQEANNETGRAIEPVNVDMSDVDTIYLGGPVWFSTFAPPLLTFIRDNNGFAGKKVCPFCTFGGHSGHYFADIQKFCPDAEVTKMLEVKEGGSDEEIAEWVSSIK
ncbi:MAG: flavodoxin [Oscillospiraceae bacterium]